MATTWCMKSSHSSRTRGSLRTKQRWCLAGEGAHQRYDFRFVLMLVDDGVEITVQPEQVSAAEWLPFERVASPTLRTKLCASGLDGRIEPVNASALIHDGHGRYLLHLRDDLPGICEPGAWSLLGGGCEPGDTSLEDTVRRELREEAGLEPATLEPFAVELASGTDSMTVLIQIFTTRWNGDPAGLPLTEGVMLAWFHPDAMPRLRLSPSILALARRHSGHSALDQAAALRPGALGPDGPKAGSTSVPHIIGVHLYLERGWPADALPEPIVPYTRAAVEAPSSTASLPSMPGAAEPPSLLRKRTSPRLPGLCATSAAGH